MRKDGNPHQWIHSLTEAQARRHLADRNLNTQGIVPVLRARLLQYEEEIARGQMSTEEGRTTGLKGTPIDRTPLEDGATADPSSSLFVLYGEVRLGDAGEDKTFRPSQAPSDAHNPRPGRASTAEAYNLMRKWNLHFSGKRGSGAEAFLLRIKEARAIVPISDADLFRCLPLFLTDTALYWM